ncbi:MAG: LytTR family DNA-binding domain-containing protein, partial [Bacteroidota bacterium]
LSIVDYLLKPFSFTRFLQAVNKATELINLKLHSNAHAGLPQESNLSNAVEEDFLLINADHKLYRLYLKDILYIQSMREYVVYYTAQEKIMAFGSLKSLEGQLPETDFIRIHKSYIVAKKSVKSLQGNQLDIGITMLPIGGVYRDKVVSKLFDRSGKD